MKKKSLLLCSTLAFLTVGALTGCGASSNKIIVWVGSESVNFYREKAADFLKNNPTFGYSIGIVGADTGSAGGQLVADNTACGDIVTIAHDNIGKLSQSNYIAPIVDEDLVSQIEADNPASFLGVIENIWGDGSDGYRYYFAAPYISQALFLYYDARYVTDQEAQTFEGLIQAAKRYDNEHDASNTKSFVVTGTDGYNNSFGVLARNLTKGNTSSLRLYTAGERYDTYAQGNDMVATMRYLQRNYKDPNGGMFELKGTAWESYIQNHIALSVIGGAWHYNSFRKAVGEENIRCAILPSFTLTAADVAGIEDVTYPEDDGYTNPKTGKTFIGLPEELQGAADPAPSVGDQYRAGSFVDCKCFVINMAKMTGPEKYGKMCQLIKYFSSKEVQQQSFLSALNVPAYDGAGEYIASIKGQVSDSGFQLGKAQTDMTPFGIPQPFANGTMNSFYYSNSTDDYYLQCIKQTGYDENLTDAEVVRKIRETFFKMEYVWKHGGLPGVDVTTLTLPGETSSPQ